MVRSWYRRPRDCSPAWTLTLPGPLWAILGRRDYFERAKRQEQAIRREMDAVRRDPTLSPAEKRQQLDALTQERNALLKGAVEAREQR